MTTNGNPSGSIFADLLKRLEGLERWRELAVRPDCCDPSDLDLLAVATDDVKALAQRCLSVRSLVNANVPTVSGPHDDRLVPRPSTIPNAGLGLFYEAREAFPAGRVLCYYYGHIHNFHSARHLVDRSYLMLLAGDVLLDAGPLPSVLSRYINDPLNDPYVNCRFGLDATTTTTPAGHRCAVVTTRDIQPGEELFVSYGQAYWSQHSTPGRIKVG